MFNKLVKRIFKPAKKQSQQNLYFFEDSRPRTNYGHEGQSATTIQSNPQTPPVVQSQAVTSKPMVFASDEEKYQVQFYSFMFGKATADTENIPDQLSQIVSQKIEQLLSNPRVIFDDLPILPLSLSTIISQINDDEFNTDRVIELIQQEPAIAAKVTELANSSFYKRDGKEVVDIRSAFMRLGVKGLSEGVINGFVSKLVPQSTIYFKLYGKRIWQHSFMNGVYAKQLIEQSEHSEDAAQGYLIGLICNLGDMIIYQLLLEAFQVVDPSAKPDSQWFKRVMLKHSQRLTYLLAKHWGFPQSILDILAIQTKLKTTAQCQRLLIQRPLACYIYEARIISELKLRYDAKDIAIGELAEVIDCLLVSPEAQALCKEEMSDHEIDLLS